MTRTRSLRWLSAGIVVCFLIGAVVLLIVSGTHTASGELWDVDRASDLKIGTEQEQTISNIEVLASNEPVKIHVGNLVDSGANLDHNATSYRIDTGEKSNSSEVYVKNPNSSNATVVVSASAISSPGVFDLHIDNIDTTNVSRYNHEGSQINRAISYTAEQGGNKAIVEFSISSPGSIEFESNAYNESTRSVFYEYSTRDDLSENTSVTLWKMEDNGDLGEKINTVEPSNDNISLKNTDIEGDTELIIGLQHSSNNSNINPIYTLDSSSLNVSVPAQVGSDPYYYRRANTDSGPNNTLLFEFNTNISDNQGYINTNFSTKDTNKIYLKNHSQAYDIEGKFLYVYPTVTANESTQNLQPEIEDISVGNITSTSSNTPFKNQFSSPVRVDKMIMDEDEYRINRGSNMGFQLNGQHKYNLSKINGKTVRKVNATDSNKIQEVSTAGLSPGYYSLNSNSETSNITIQISNSSINLEANDSVTNTQIPVDVEASGTNRTATLTISESNDSKIFQEEISLNNNTTLSRSISVPQQGTYTIEVRDLNTGITTSQEVEVTEDRSPRLHAPTRHKLFSSSLVDLVLNSTYDFSSVLLTSPENTTTTLELTTSERGPTPVTLNTYASPDSPSEFVSTGSGASLESVSGDTDPLSPGTYDLTLRSEHGTEIANDTATVTVEPRSTNDLTAYTTREVSPGEFENASAVREAVADGTLTPATNATANDTVVYAVNATGLTGLRASANASLDRGADLDRLEGVSFGVAPTESGDSNESAGGDALGVTPNESAVHLDRDGLYLVADGERAFGTETTPDPGETFAAAFRVDDDRLRRTAAGDRHRVTAELTYAGADTTDGDDHIETGGASTDEDESADSELTDPDGSPDDSGATGGSASGGGPTGDSGGSGGAAGASDSDATGDATGTDGGSSPGNSSESDANRSTAPPGVGISIAPGDSEIPPSAGPPELFDTERSERPTADSESEGSRSADGRSDGDAVGGGDDATSDDSIDSSGSGESPATDSSGSSGSSADEADASDLGYDDAPIRSTAYDLPGFGAVASLAAVAGASLLARRRAREP